MTDYTHPKHGIVQKVGPPDNGWVQIRTTNGFEYQVHLSSLTPLAPNKSAVAVTRDASVETNELLKQILMQLKLLRKDINSMWKQEKGLL
jgi:hypothetical protein